MNTKVIVVNEGDDVRLTVPGQEGKTCVYVSLINGKLVLEGGVSIIGSIEGSGMIEKVREYKSP